MQSTFQYPRFRYQPPPELVRTPRQGAPGKGAVIETEPSAAGFTRARHPVVIIGAGPVGLTAAIDCAQHGVPVVLLDDNDTVSIGSRAVCYAKRSLEVLDRLGCGEALVAKGVSWKIGRVFFRDDPVYHFDLQPQPGHKMPAMINLQQYYLESELVARCQALTNIQLRWKHRVSALVQHEDHVQLTIATPDGEFGMQAGWVVACDGASSAVRSMVGASFEGQVFHDRFLIADVVMKAGFPPERWFWFDPPFHRGQSVLLHKQSDDVWRIDFQLGPDADPELEKQPERVVPRIQAMLGPDTKFELEWLSVYQFACRRIDRFRHGRVLFAGDSAHQVSPFGARGANSGMQDADNLGWKLALVVHGSAPAALLDSYAHERSMAADDNLLNSTRATDFITPKNAASSVFRDAVLELATDWPFARSLINSGRLSMPTPYRDSPLNTPDDAVFEGGVPPGCPCPDAPLALADGSPGWLLTQLAGRFTLLCFGPPPEHPPIRQGSVQPRLLSVGDHPGADLRDTEGLIGQRFAAQGGTVCLIRPDQYVAARWRRFEAAAIQRALARCLAS